LAAERDEVGDEKSLQVSGLTFLHSALATGMGVATYKPIERP
jgi:hypothetical protein